MALESNFFRSMNSKSQKKNLEIKINGSGEAIPRKNQGFSASGGCNFKYVYISYFPIMEEKPQVKKKSTVNVYQRMLRCWQKERRHFLEKMLVLEKVWPMAKDIEVTSTVKHAFLLYCSPVVVFCKDDMSPFF